MRAPRRAALLRAGAANDKRERHRRESASAILEEMCEAGEGERVYVRDMMEALKGRAFGVAALAFALPVCLPMPPGVPTVMGAALLIVSVQMIFGRDTLWLPGFIMRRSIDREKLKAAIAKIRPRLEKLERAAKPSMLFLTGDVGRRFFGVVMLALAIMLILPIPFFGNMPLGFAAAILALGLIERDGYFVLAGLLATVVAFVITGSIGILAVKAFARVA
jgi:hypothetical protein